MAFGVRRNSMAATAKDPWVWDTQGDELLLVASRLLAARLSASASGDLAESRKIATETKACIELAAMLLDGESVMKANSAATAGEWDKQHAELLDVPSRLLAGRLSGRAAGDLADSVKMARQSGACAALAVLLVDDVERALGRRPFDVSGLGPVEVERAAKRTSAAI